MTTDEILHALESVKRYKRDACLPVRVSALRALVEALEAADKLAAVPAPIGGDLALVRYIQARHGVNLNAEAYGLNKWPNNRTLNPGQIAEALGASEPEPVPLAQVWDSLRAAQKHLMVMDEGPASGAIAAILYSLDLLAHVVKRMGGT